MQVPGLDAGYDDRELEWLWRRRYSSDGRLAPCPGCHDTTMFHRVTRRRAYACDRCGHQIRPAAGTPFSGSRLPLSKWFEAVALLCRADVSPPQLAFALGISRKAARRMHGKLTLTLADAGPQAGLLQAIADDQVSRSENQDALPAVPLGTADRILAAACRVIARRGMIGLRISDIAAEARVSAALVHYHYRSKSEVLLAALEWSDARAHERLEAVVRRADPVESLAEFVRLTAPTDEESWQEGALWIEIHALAHAKPEYLTAVQRLSDRYSSALESILTAGVRRRLFHPTVPVAECCARFVAYADGVSARAVLGYKDADAALALARMASYCEELLRLHPGALRV